MGYEESMQEILQELKESGARPDLLLHCCCGPCATAVLETLAPYFSLTAYYFNPNIEPAGEYALRAGELERMIHEETGGNTGFLQEPFDPSGFREMARGLEREPEGGQRCQECYRMRLMKTAETAARLGIGWMGTTLSVSPHKDPEKLNRVGKEAAAAFGVRWLPAEFRKKNRYRRSVELSRQHGMYRQDYCGCLYSRAESAHRRRVRKNKETFE